MKEHVTKLFEDLKADNTKEHERIEKGITDTDSTLKEHNGRLRKMEEWRNYILGAIGVLGFICVGLIFPAIKEYYSKANTIDEVKKVISDMIQKGEIEITQ